MLIVDNYKVRTYAQILETVKRYEEVSLITGSGLSQGRSHRFGYPSIKKQMLAEYGHMFWVKNLIDFPSANIELYLQMARSDYKLGLYPHIIEQIQKAFLHAIIDAHEEPGYFDSSVIQAVDTFLSQFKNVFCLQFDANVYWVNMQGSDRLDDGFRRRDDELRYVGADKNSRKVYYPHGSAFIAKRGNYRVKLEGSNGRLFDAMRASCEAAELELVLGSSSEEKVRIINSSRYLRDCLAALTQLKGAAIIYGAAISEADDHILQALVRSDLQYLAIGVFEPKFNAERFLERVLAIRKMELEVHGAQKMTIQLFDSATAALWQPAYNEFELVAA